MHDFPEFLCDHHLDLCDVIPPNCVQMRNLVLSAFPRAMRLPDPFTPNLKVDLLPEISQSPRVTCGADDALKTRFPDLQFKSWTSSWRRASMRASHRAAPAAWQS